MPDQTILAIDPGETESACVGYDPGTGELVHAWIMENVKLARLLRDGAKACLVIEDMDSYGMPIGKSTMTTLQWIGRFQEAWPGWCRLITRRTIKLHMCNSVRAKDSNVRQALIDRFGGSREKAIGTKKNPGPLYGIKTHLWAALAVAVTAAEQREVR